MYLACLAQQVDIVCGDGNQAWYVRSKTRKAERTDARGNLYIEPLNGLLNTVARFGVARLNRGQPIFDSACMEYIDNNAYDTIACPEFHYDMWDLLCCATLLLWEADRRPKGNRNSPRA